MKLKIIIFVLFALSFSNCQNRQKKRTNSIFQSEVKGSEPNILFLLADDLGYGELGCYGQKTIKTPVLDNLAKKGMRFTDFYAGDAVCSPSRAVLMTGKSSSFSTIRGNKGYFNNEGWRRVALKKDEITLGEMLKKVDYQTAFIGKWHLDTPEDISTWAFNRGFDYAVQEQWGVGADGTVYDEQMHWINGKQDSVYYKVNEWECKDEFRTNLAFKYLDKIEKEKPFFLFMSYRAPHGHEREIGNKTLYADKGWPPKERLHAAKITLLDKQIGRLLSKLKEIGKLDNTLVLFTSDNGPHGEGGHKYEFFDSNGILRGFKRDTYEGGIRVPLIAYWKGKIKAGKTTNFIFGFQDLMPTFAEVAGIEVPAQSKGISILPLLTGKNQKKHKNMNWEFQRVGGGNKKFRQAVRQGKWKGVRYGINSKTELYNLETDISETNNLAADYPEIVKKMNQLFKDKRTEIEGFPYGGVIQNKKLNIKSIQK